MNNLVSDFATHPLMPGSLLASIMGDPQSRRTQSLGNAALVSFNKLPTLDIVSHFQKLGLISNEQVSELIAADNQYVISFKELCRRIPEVAQATGCDKKSVEQLARALFSAKLMSEYLEILTPPQLSYEKTARGTVDLLEALFDSFREIAGGAWSVFFPRAEFSLITDASAQFWMACLYSSRTEEMVNGFVGLFLTAHRDRLQTLNRFIQYLLRQISVICEDYDATSAGQSRAVAEEKLEQVLQELDELVGIATVKDKVKETANFARIQQLRIAQGLKPIPTSYHSVYTGNPGTGKTTVARLMGRIYKSLGVLKKGHLIECDRSALVGEYVGQTAPRTNAVIDSALDGILFIDEAYGLVKEHEDYGQEAIETLLKRMEDDRDRLIVIVAGYPEEMDRFIHSNPGLQSRFNRFIEFPDYTPQELCRIFALMCRRNGLTLTPASKEKVLHHFACLHKERGENFGNARLARNCFEAVINAQASRLAASGTFDTRALTVLEAQDLKTPAQDSLEEYRKGRKGYIVKCTNCNQVYSWSPDLDIIDAICTKCGKTYNCEFGELLS